MAKALYLVTRSGQSTSTVKNLVNGVYAVVINKDDGQTNPQIIADAVAQLRIGGHAVPSNYFDTVTLISDLTSGTLKDNKDCFAFLRRDTQKIEG